MQAPAGMDSPQVLKLVKALYGLKQASRTWYIALHNELTKLGFVPSPNDPCLYIRSRPKHPHDFLCVFVDDLFLLSDDENLVSALSKTFEMRDLGDLSWALGMRVTYHPDGSVKLDQESYTLGMLKQFGFDQCNPSSTPAVGTEKLSKQQCPSDADKHQHAQLQERYRQLVGALNWLSVATRPDISHALGVARLPKLLKSKFCNLILQENLHPSRSLRSFWN